MVARFSTVGGESGSSDTARDPRGFSIKVKTQEGNWDRFVFSLFFDADVDALWLILGLLLFSVANNTPVFFLRDPMKFPVFIHTQKRNPRTNLKDASQSASVRRASLWALSLIPSSFYRVDMFWDHLSQNEESIHQVMILFSDRGTPQSCESPSLRLAGARP